MCPRTFSVRQPKSSNVLPRRKNFVKTVRKQYGNPDSHPFFPYFICQFFRFNLFILFHSCYSFCFFNSFLLLFVFFRLLQPALSLSIYQTLSRTAYVQLIVFVFLWQFIFLAKQALYPKPLRLIFRELLYNLTHILFHCTIIWFIILLY